MNFFQRIFDMMKTFTIGYGVFLSFCFGLLFGLMGFLFGIASLIASLSCMGLVEARSSLPMGEAAWLCLSLAVIFLYLARLCFTKVPDSLHRFKEKLLLPELKMKLAGRRANQKG